jgi:hypothetical protein
MQHVVLENLKTGDSDESCLVEVYRSFGRKNSYIFRAEEHMQHRKKKHRFYLLNIFPTLKM